MKVSIITVTYNAGLTIENSIKTVISQSYPNIEYIIIDGASTDNTLEIIGKYKDKISKIISESDKGIYNAMNKGIKVSTGDILYFLNANDYLFDQKVIEDAVETLKKAKMDILFGNMSFIDADGVEKELRLYANVDKLFWIGECVCHQGIFYRREVFEKIGEYDESYRLLADYDFNLKALLKYGFKFKYFDSVISKFTLGGQSNSVETLEIQNKEKEEIVNKYFNSFHIKSNKILNKTFRSIARNPKLRKIAGIIFGFSL